MDHMRTFGSIVHVKVTKGHLSKLEDKSQRMIFIGYELGMKAYKCFDRSTPRLSSVEMQFLKKMRSGLGQRKLKTLFHSPSYLISSLIRDLKTKLNRRMKKRTPQPK